MDEPRAPQASDFGLGEGEVPRLEAAEQARSRLIHRLGEVVRIGTWIAVAIVFAVKSYQGHLAELGGGVLGAVCGGGVLGAVCATAILGGLLGGILEFVFLLISDPLYPADPRLRNVRAYQLEVTLHAARVKAWREKKAADALRRAADFWMGLDAGGLEREVGNLFQRLGHNVRFTGGAGDGGVDVYVDADTIIQCKHHKKPVGPAAARELLGSMQSTGAKKAILVCPTGFSDGTRSFANRVGIELWDVKRLIDVAEQASRVRA